MSYWRYNINNLPVRQHSSSSVQLNMESGHRIYKTDHNCTAAQRQLTPYTLLFSVHRADDIRFYTSIDDLPPPPSALLHSAFKENSLLNTNNSLVDNNNNNTRCNSFQSQGSCNFPLESTIIIPLQKLSKTCYDFPHYKPIATDLNCQTFTERSPQQLLVKCACQITIKFMIGLWDKRQSIFVT